MPTNPKSSGSLIPRQPSNQPTIFNFDSDHPVRTIQDENGDPWFVALDVCTILDLENVSRALDRLDEDEKAEVTTSNLSSNGVQQLRKLAIINESGLYSLILTSRKPEAKAFKKWVTSEVLPTLRKTGSYAVKPRSTFDLMRETIDQLEAQSARITQVESRVEQIAEKVTALDSDLDFYTIVGWANVHNIKITRNEAQSLGMRAAAYCKRHEIKYGQTTHPIYGKQGTYPSEVLEVVFEGVK